LRMPVDALLLEHFLAQQAKQHIVGWRVLGVQLKALALEILHRTAALGQLVAEWIAEYRQAAILAPVLRKATADAVAGLGEAALRLRGGVARATFGQRQQQRQQYGATSIPLPVCHRLILLLTIECCWGVLLVVDLHSVYEPLLYQFRPVRCRPIPQSPPAALLRGRSPGGEVQEAGRSLLARGAGARSPRPVKQAEQRDKPALIEKLGVLSRSSRTAAQREAPRKAAATRAARKAA